MGGNKGYAVFKLRLQLHLFSEQAMSQLFCGYSYLCYPQPEPFSVTAHKSMEGTRGFYNEVVQD